MLDRIERLAYLSVSRACGFAALAIATFFIGLSGDMPLALKAAGILSLLTCAVLLLKAQMAPQWPYKRTEIWLLLRPEERPAANIAQELIGTVMRETFLHFALHAAIVAILLLVGGLGFGAIAR